MGSIPGAMLRDRSRPRAERRARSPSPRASPWSVCSTPTVTRRWWIIVIPGNDDALKSVRLVLDRFDLGRGRRRSEPQGAKTPRPVDSTEEKPSEDFHPTDEPRPTRGKRARRTSSRRKKAEALRASRPRPRSTEAAAPAPEAAGQRRPSPTASPRLPARTSPPIAERRRPRRGRRRPRVGAWLDAPSD